MEIVIISLAAFLTAILTFFSGFGLGTILAPVFAVFFPVEVAIALTGVVHFANNLFKVALVGRHFNKEVLFKFGIPAVLFAAGGASLLSGLAGIAPLASYELWGNSFDITLINLVISILLICFPVFEILPPARKFQPAKNKLWIGGALSGFFGGLSGMQGAIRSAFLIKSGLTKESYVATGVIIACAVDVTRLAIYASWFSSAALGNNLPLLLSAILSALAGAFIGKKMLKKVTFRSIQVLVAIMLILIGIALGMGII